jgi:hypothetical protein
VAHAAGARAIPAPGDHAARTHRSGTVLTRPQPDGPCAWLARVSPRRSRLARSIHVALDIDVAIAEQPFGVPIRTPYPQDFEHARCRNREAIERFGRVLDRRGLARRPPYNAARRAPDPNAPLLPCCEAADDAGREPRLRGARPDCRSLAATPHRRTALRGRETGALTWEP